MLAAGGSALAEGIDLLPPAVEATFEADFTPKALPKREQAPISLRTSVEFMNSDKSHPPALKEFEIEEDRHLRLNLRGVPACRGVGIQDGIPLQQKCKEALVGTGRMFVNIQLPEQEPFVTRSKVSIYKDGVKSGRSLLLATYITAPTPAVIVSTVAVKKVSDSRYGLNLVGLVPKIAGGAGSITRLAFRFHKGIFSATCPADRKIDTHFAGIFVEGTRIFGGVVRTCTGS